MPGEQIEKERGIAGQSTLRLHLRRRRSDCWGRGLLQWNRRRILYIGAHRWDLRQAHQDQEAGDETGIHHNLESVRRVQLEAMFRPKHINCMHNVIKVTFASQNPSNSP